MVARTVRPTNGLRLTAEDWLSRGQEHGPLPGPASAPGPWRTRSWGWVRPRGCAFPARSRPHPHTGPGGVGGAVVSSLFLPAGLLRVAGPHVWPRPAAGLPLSLQTRAICCLCGPSAQGYTGGFACPSFCLPGVLLGVAWPSRGATKGGGGQRRGEISMLKINKNLFFLGLGVDFCTLENF